MDNLETKIAQVLAPILVGYERQIKGLEAKITELEKVAPAVVVDVEVQQLDADPRQIWFVQHLNNGEKIACKVSVPMPLYKGIWEAGYFVNGDMVTHKGAAWIAQVEKTDKEPGTCEDWRCFVQRGKPGPRGRDALAKT